MLRFGILLLSFLFALYGLSTVVFEREKILSSGNSYKFLIRPIDPADPFRGKYISLNFAANRFIVTDKTKFSEGEDVFVILEKDENGFAKIKTVSHMAPSTADYVKANVQYGTIYGTDVNDSILYVPTEITINYPFDKFYVEESKAPEAEKLLNVRDTVRNAYAKIFIKDGKAVIENVYIGKQPLKDFIISKK